MNADYFAWRSTPEGRIENEREMLQLREDERKRRHTFRFHRWADNHDWRIPRETRIAVLTRANEHCERCRRFVYGGCSPGLELHHLNYDRAYGAETPEDLEAICGDCHAQAHGYRIARPRP
jgi:5-methylcytosine-specific restriction endonuclease McrA